MENEQERIITTPSENNDGSGFEIVKTEPLSEQDSLVGHSWERVDKIPTPSEIKASLMDGRAEASGVSDAEKGWGDAQAVKEEMAAAVKPLDDSEYQVRKQQIASSNGVQQYTRARGNEALVVNKFVLDGVSYPGDVVIGWAERHTPIRWCDPKDVITDHLDFYLPCKPALKTDNPIPGVVAIKRKDGKLILLCGNIDLRFPFKAHVFNENQLTKGKLADSLRLASLWDNGGIELQKAAADAASVLNMKPNKS